MFTGDAALGLIQAGSSGGGGGGWTTLRLLGDRVRSSCRTIGWRVIEDILSLNALNDPNLPSYGLELPDFDLVGVSPGNKLSYVGTDLVTNFTVFPPPRPSFSACSSIFLADFQAELRNHPPALEKSSKPGRLLLSLT